MKYKLLVLLALCLHIGAFGRAHRLFHIKSKQQARSMIIAEAQTAEPAAYISSKDGHVTIYPNPTTDKVFVRGDGQIIYSIEVMNMLGAVVLREEISNGVVSLSSLQPGMYMLHVYGSDGRLYLVSKITKQ